MKKITQKDLHKIIKKNLQEFDETDYKEPEAKTFASLTKNDKPINQKVDEYFVRKKRN